MRNTSRLEFTTITVNQKTNNFGPIRIQIFFQVKPWIRRAEWKWTIFKNWTVPTTRDPRTETGRFRARTNKYFQTLDPIDWQICLKSKILELKFYLKKNFHKLISVDQMVRILKRILISYPLYFLVWFFKLHFINGLSICLGHMTSFAIGFLMLDVSSISEKLS